MDKKYTIMQVIPQLELGGAEKNAVDCAIAVAEQGWRSILVSNGGRMAQRALDAGCEHIELPMDTRNPLGIWQNGNRLAKILREQQVDLIHAHSRAPAWSAKLAAKRMGTHFITTHHGAYSQKSIFKRWYNGVMVQGECVIANSNWTANLVKKRFPEAASKMHMIEPGTDFSQFDPALITPKRQQALLKNWGLTGDETICLHLARLSPTKGAYVSIAAAREVLKHHDDVVFIIAGEAPKHQEYRDRLSADIAAIEAEYPKLRDKIKLVGRVDDPAAAFSLASVVMVATVNAEAFGLAAVEAQAMGVAPIVADKGAVPDTVYVPKAPDDKRTGWHFEAGSADALAKAILHVLELKEGEREAVGQYAREYVLERFSLTKMNRSLCDLYVQVIEI
jgi:glycosyltransferase involved in cell wall biosynthesis